MPTIYPIHVARTLALEAQGLARSTSAKTPDDLFTTIEKIGCVQIDTLQMVRRSQYVLLWSRVGNYNPDDLDTLLSEDRRLFEYWYHAACLIPLTRYRYLLPRMRAQREKPFSYIRGWLAQDDNQKVMAQVLDYVRENGAVRVSDFEHPKRTASGWWDWKPTKIALEVLYNQGDLMIAGRVKFQRIYDLTERVLPDWVDASEPSVDEANIHLLEHAAKAFGICDPDRIGEYANINRTTARPLVRQLLAAGILVSVQAELAHELVVHRDNLSLLEPIADGEISASHTTFLTPFDNLLWAKDRIELFWNFEPRIEAYTPEPKRRWGYFCLPILHRGRLIGRFDPKLERKTGTLRLKALHLEPGIEPDEAMIADVADAMRDFLLFHDAGTLIIEKSNPPIFGEKLLAAMG